MTETIRKYMHTNIDTVHYWNDGWELWSELRDAINEMSTAARMCKISVYDKEKYGSYNCTVISFWVGNLFNSTRYDNKWYNKLDNIIANFLRIIGVVYIMNCLYKKRYNKHVQRVIQRHPKLVNELLVDNDLYYLVKPGKYGVADGQFVFNKYWKKCE